MTEAKHTPEYIKGGSLPEEVKRLELGQIEPIYDALGHMAESPASNDERIKAYALAARDLIATDDRFRLSLSTMLDFRKDRGRPTIPLYAANLSLRVSQHLVRKRADYGELSKTPAGWTELVTSVLDDPSLKESFDTYLAINEVQTNVPARYKGPQLILSLNMHRFDRPINLLDVGPSVGAGLKGLILGKIDHPIRTMIPGKAEIPETLKLIESENVTNYVNQKLRTPIEFAQCAGLDLMGVRDLQHIEWTESCFYPTEIVEGKGGTVQQFNELSRQEVPQISFSQTDFASEDMVHDFIKEKSPIDKYDVITMITMANQLTIDEVGEVLKNAKSILSPGGVIILQDFVRYKPDAPNGLEFFSSWHPYTYRTLLIEPDGLSEGRPEELLWWSNARCTDVIIAPSANLFMSSEPIPKED